MINLLPPVAKRSVTHEYWRRVITVWLFLCSIALLLISAMLIPTLVLIDSVHLATERQIAAAESSESQHEELITNVKNLNAIINEVNQGQERIAFSELLYMLDEIASSAVALTQFSFVTTEQGELEKISIVGVANSRNDLSSFKERLESHERFSEVELPLSNLVKERDITFTLSATYVPPET